MLSTALPGFDGSLVNEDVRAAAFARFRELRSGRERPGRYWRIDLDALDISQLRLRSMVAVPSIEATLSRGAIACDLATAVREHGVLVARAFGTSVDTASSKFAALATAFANTGAFVYLPAGVCIDEHIAITYRAGDDALFPYTLVLAEAGSQCTIIERIESASENAFVCGVAEVVAAERTRITYASAQELPSTARMYFTRKASPGSDAHMSWAAAELGGELSASTIEVAIGAHGIEAEVAALFFPGGDEHVDMVSSINHNVGDSRSNTVIKSAATGSGQARYLGNIRILAHAQGSSAALRDDALLLSPKAHIDSIPALEIAANDVQAFHGATVGAIDQDQIFYMASRGIPPNDAEKMIALGFFEPAIEMFPTHVLRERLRAALERKVRS